MVRGNWQRRVERTEARRKQAKQRKQRNEDKRHHKLLVQDLLRLLDQQTTTARTIHVWVDDEISIPPSWLDPPPGAQSKRTTRTSNSLEEQQQQQRKGGHWRSGKKKTHPRSRESMESDATAQQEENSNTLWLCQAHFFHDACKGRCRFIHYASPYQTLCQVLDDEQELVAGETAAQLSVSSDEHAKERGAVEMVHYFSFDVQYSKGEATTVSDHITNAFSQKEAKLSSIVYLALDDMLVFDRYREGIVLSDDARLALELNADGGSRRKLSIASETGTFHRLPGTILEHILTFLPDESVAVATQVCKGWFTEIGRNSPNLWLFLLKRRKWPLPPATDRDDNEANPRQSVLDTQRRFRQEFLKHYSVLRDATAIQSSFSAIEQKKHVVSREMAYQDFSVPYLYPCSGVQNWAPNQILAAYRDLSLRLFESGAKEGENELFCKEVLVLSVDPYRNTKKRDCKLMSFAVDEEWIGCLCSVKALHTNMHTNILTVISRENFLLGESGCNASGETESNLKVIDIGEAVLNYILSIEGDDDEHKEELLHFLDNGGEIGGVDVGVPRYSQIAACGYGRFLLKVRISFPDEGHSLAPMLVLFSASVGAIVWTRDCTLLNMDRAEGAEAQYSSVRRQHTTGSRVSCSIAVSHARAFAPITIFDIEPSGSVSQTQFMQYTYPSTLWDEIGDGWISADHFRRLGITSTHVVVVDSFFIPDEHDFPNRVPQRTVVSFHPRLGTESNSKYLPVQRNMTPYQLACVRDEHVILLCNQDINQDGDGTTLAILLHVPSGSEIGRQAWSRKSEACFLRMTPDANETLGVGMSSMGVVMTGRDVRARASRTLVLPDLPEQRSSKKKKKGKARKSGKKDGFARGMSLRG